MSHREVDDDAVRRLLRQIHDAAKSVGDTRGEEYVARHAAEHALAALRAERAVVLAFDGAGVLSVLAEVPGAEATLPGLGTARVDVSCVVRQARPIRVADLPGASAEGVSAFSHFRFAAIEAGSKVLGLLGLELQRELSGTDLELLCSMGSITGAALANVRALRELREANETLEERVAERTQELERTVRALESSQTRLMAAQQQALAGRLVAGVVHELNSPVAVLVSASQTLLRLLEPASPDGPSTARGAHQSSPASDRSSQLRGALREARDRIDSVLRRLQRFVNLDASEVAIVELGDLVRDVAVVLGAGGSAPTFDVEATAPVHVRCNPAALSQSLLSLTGTITHAGGEEAPVRGTVRSDGSWAALSVDATGLAAALPKLREAFDLGWAVRNEESYLGLSLGLPMAKRIVEGLGGNIDIHALENDLRLLVRLPLHAAPR